MWSTASVCALKDVLTAAQGFKACGESGPLENQAVLEPGGDAVEFEPEFGGKGEERFS